MFCTKCGFQIKDGYKFCPKCGTPVYVEKENPKTELEKKIGNEVVMDVKSEPDNGGMPTTKGENTKIDSKSQSKPIADSLILKELNIEGVKNQAEKGDKEAILKQAFRYEIGIGCETNKEKAMSLYKQIEGNNELLPIEELKYRNIIGVE